MFYIEVPETYPRTYQLVAELPPVPADKRWRGYVFVPTPAFIVHSKMHLHQKAQEYVVRGVAKDGRLLVQTHAITDSDWDVVGTWHEVECGDTTEGYRFKRYTLKPIATLIKIASSTARVKARVEVQMAKLADRAEKCGECPACFGDYVVTDKTKMVHHGYERPGDGMIHGDCYGVGYAPFEVSCDGTKAYRAVVDNALQLRKATLVALPTLETVKVQSGSKFVGGRFWPEYQNVKRGEPGFDAEIETRRRQLEGQIDSMKRHLAELNKKIASWKPQTFPRVTKKAKVS